MVSRLEIVKQMVEKFDMQRKTLCERYPDHREVITKYMQMYQSKAEREWMDTFQKALDFEFTMQVIVSEGYGK